MGVLRDNKAILNKIEKQMQFFKEVMLVGDVRHLCTLSWFAFNKSICSNYLSLKIVIPKNAFQWLEDGDTLYYCVDLRKVLSYNNIIGFILDNILETDLGNALENGIDNLYDSLCGKGTNFSLDEVKTFIKDVYIPMRKNIENVKLMSNTMNGKDERYVYSLDDIMKGNTAINYRKKLTLLIRSNNHFDIPLGGAFD